jgi:periplasmic protein TonB
MASLVLHPQHEYSPHVIRTLAMACAIALNLTALLIALRPLPMAPIALPVVQPETTARILDHPRVLPVPPLPILTPVQRVHRLAPTRPLVQTVSETTTVPVANAVMTSERSTITTPETRTDASVSPPVSADATIAYETATPPPYPIAEVRAGVQGTVLLRVRVDESGKPVQVVILKSSGSHALDEAARNHVLAAWRFHPAQRDGHAIQAWAQVPVEFKLSGA